MKRYLVSFLCAVVLITAVSAQEVSDKQNIAVFSLSHSDWPVPSEAIVTAEQQITEVLTNNGGFDVKGLEQGVKAGDVSFTAADFEELDGSFIAVVPSLTFYNAEDDGSGEQSWEVEMQTSFSFVLVGNSELIAGFTINTFGIGDNQGEAALDAAAAISGQLEYELKNIEEFQQKSGILEVLPGGQVIVELEAGINLRKGDEFSIMTAETLDSGEVVMDKTGLLVISDVKEDVSFGRILYSRDEVLPGDQLVEFPRAGIDISPYGSLLIDIDDWQISGGLAGAKFVLSSFVYDVRPFLGFEFPILTEALDGGWPGLPVTAYGGGELMWFLGRFQVEPSILFGVTGLFPLTDSDSFNLTHVGGKIEIDLNWMFIDRMRLFLNAGYTHWFAINSTALPSVSAYGGIFAGLGVTFKL